MIPILLIWLCVHLSANAEISNGGPLVYHNWPPISAKRTHSTSHQLPLQPHHRHHQQQHHHNHGTQQFVYHQPMHALSSSSAAVAAAVQSHNSPLSSSSPTTSSSSSSASAAGTYLQSPSNLVYTQQKLRPLQTMALLNMQHNRLVRPSMLKLSAASNQQPHYLMPSANKPLATHIAHQHYGGGGSSASKHNAAMRHNSQQQQQHHPMLATTTTRATFVKVAAAAGPNNKHIHLAKKPHHQPASSSQQPMVDYVFEKPNMSHYGLPITASSASAMPQHNNNGLSTQSPLPTFGTPRPQQPPRQPQTVIKYNPIHTIQAPNLSPNDPSHQFGNVLKTPLIDSNHLFEKDTMFPTHLAFTADRPTSIPQYQVTETPHDYAIRNSVVSGNLTPLFIGEQNLQFGPMIGAQQQHPSGNAFVDHGAFSAPGNQPAASVLVPHQLSFPSTNHLKPSSGHQQHMHMLQQFAGQMNSVPLAAYNPTYLVTQSNQLFDQHKQHLFKPERHQYVQQQQQPNTAVLRSPPSAEASIEGEFLPSYQLPSSGDYVQLHSNNPPPQHTQQPNRAIFNRAPSSSSFPSGLQYHPQVSSIEIQQQPVSAALSAQEVSNLLNYGSLQLPTIDEHRTNDDGFVASNFYQSNNKNPPSLTGDITGNEDTIYRHQQENEERINEATRQQSLLIATEQRLNADRKFALPTKRPEPTESTIFVTRTPELRASEAEAESAQKRQQQRIAEHLAAVSDIRIYVPDEDYSVDQEQHNSDMFNKRSDDFDSDEHGNHSADLTMSASSNYNQSSDGKAATLNSSSESTVETETDGAAQTTVVAHTDIVAGGSSYAMNESDATTTEHSTTLDNSIVVDETTDKAVLITE